MVDVLLKIQAYGLQYESLLRIKQESKKVGLTITAHKKRRSTVTIGRIQQRTERPRKGANHQKQLRSPRLRQQTRIQSTRKKYRNLLSDLVGLMSGNRRARITGKSYGQFNNKYIVMYSGSLATPKERLSEPYRKHGFQNRVIFYQQYQAQNGTRFFYHQEKTGPLYWKR